MGKKRKTEMRLVNSLQPVLLAVLLVHGFSSSTEDEAVIDLNDSRNVHDYAGPNGFAASTRMPKNERVLRFMKASKTQCKRACDADPKCVGFKQSNSGCSLMGYRKKTTPKPKKQVKPKVKKVRVKPLKRVSNAAKSKAKLVLKAKLGKFRKMSKRKLKTIKDQARHHAKLKPNSFALPRKTKRAAKRSMKTVAKMRKRQLTARYEKAGERSDKQDQSQDPQEA